MSSSKKIDMYRDFAASIYLCEAQNPIPPPPPYTLNTCVQYTNSHTKGGGGGGWRVEQREGLEGQQFSKLGRK